MDRLIAVLSLALLASGCTGTTRPQVDQGPFVGFDVSKLSEGDRRTLTEASADFSAVVAGKKPIHAVFDEEASLPSDGGTTFYRGHGYRLTVLISLSSFGASKGMAYGPILQFEPSFAPGNTSEISEIRVYSQDALRELLGEP
jgi:hypothetical protein